MNSKLVNMVATTAAAALLAGCGSTEIREVPVEDSTPTPTGDVHALSLGEANQPVGEVVIRNDAETLFVTVTGFTGVELADVRVCVGTSAFHYLAPESCGYRASLSGSIAKATVTVPLADLFETVEPGDVLYIQAAAAIGEGRSTAKGYAYAGVFKGRVGYTIAGAEQSGACVMTADAWAGGKKEWPVRVVTVGGIEYSEDELVDLLATASAGDASLMLAKQAIAARLNAAAGAPLPLGVTEALASMELWLPQSADVDGVLPFQLAATPEYQPNTDAFERAVNTSEMIRQFNAGKLASPVCE